ncbi:MAG: hypothetical protein WBG48_04880 [Pricia sp.]
MQKTNKIAAFFFLGLFSLMMLHQAFPHLHHQHEDSHSHSDVAHSGEHHHHDDSSPEKDKSPSGFLGFLMDMHVHSTVSSDIVVLKRNTVEQQTIVDKDVADNAFDIQFLFSYFLGQNASPTIYHPPNNYFNPYSSYPDLRGPPSLG